MTRLGDVPNLTYLVRDFDVVYRQGSAGGSTVIRSHMRRVRETISDVLEENPPVVDRDPQPKPVVAHLPRALDLGARGVLAAMSRSIERVAPRLTWEYGYDKVRPSLAKKYAYCEIVGPQGPVVTPDVILGLVLFAPRTTYPQHAHREIEESYVAVAGAWSENDAAVHAPGSLILNRSHHEHRITTGISDPCLLAYAWLGPRERLCAPGMRFSPGRKPRTT